MTKFGGLRVDLTTASAPTGHARDGTNLQRDNSQAQSIGLDLKPWESRMQSLIETGAAIITFRGAGTVNGIESEAEGKAVATIRDAIMELRGKGVPVVLMYDGDGDNRAKPDVGSVFGQLADAFKQDTGVVAIAAQTEGWYNPSSPNAPISSATGTPFETYVFSDKLEGAHASLTQSAQLVAYSNYSQVFVGPAGQIAFKQLQDVSDKAVAHRDAALSPVKVAIFITPNNPAVGDQLATQLDAATGNDQLIAKITPRIEQRRNHPYGFLCTSEGDFSVDAKKYPGIAFEVAGLK